LVLVVVLSIAAVIALTTRAAGRSPSSSSFRIEKLHGSLFRTGSLYWVRLRATVCDPHPAPGGTYPAEIDVTHFVVSNKNGRRHWWFARAVRDRAPWLVPLDETWKGKSCGPVQVDDPITPGHYGVESIGNPLTCYGVSLAIVAHHGQRARRRTIVSCGKRNP
jgi:hypothetical protein